MYGVDYGSKLAGTTVVAYLSEKQNKVGFTASEKNKDADLFLLNFFSLRSPGVIFLDAPLSLPTVYCIPNTSPSQDYFYRQCDRELGAMSPMFLGGLTARAMKLSDRLRQDGFAVIETYPARLANLLDLKRYGYKSVPSSIAECLGIIHSEFALNIPVEAAKSWHHFDALLALCSSIRMQNATAIKSGNESEGFIIY